LKSSNTTTDKSTETNESQEEGNSETIVTNYEVSKTVEHIINAVGTIERLSVAVLVDGVYAPPENAEEKAESVYQPRSPEELDRLAAIVKNAVGFDQQRSDQIEVVNIGFDRRELVQEQEQLDTMYQRDFYLEIARKVGLVLLIALAVLFLRGKIKRLFAALGKMAPAPRTAPPTLADEQSEESADAPRRIRPQRRQPRLVDEMQDAAKGQPEELARVIKTMMIE
ncbi:MAG TPA: flagellar M-ring protein FliF C-terminal domain-containing protein, partial [Candidatus Deferrimicrobium sp.]|nr:flagellar M-ring protein FliF C-terminal domain-containing protein [Candidatus Deferrimicrobium sp.]